MARKYLQGIFTPENPQKYAGDATNIVFRSSWERKFMNWCDQNESVTMWCSEEIVIPYYSRADGKMRRYFTDFMIKYIGTGGKEKVALIEVKPEAQTLAPIAKRGKKQKTLMNETYNFMVNTDKWEAAKEFAAKNGMEFIVITEKQLGIKK